MKQRYVKNGNGMKKITAQDSDFRTFFDSMDKINPKRSLSGWNFSVKENIFFDLRLELSFSLDPMEKF